MTHEKGKTEELEKLKNQINTEKKQIEEKYRKDISLISSEKEKMESNFSELKNIIEQRDCIVILKLFQFIKNSTH